MRASRTAAARALVGCALVGCAGAAPRGGDELRELHAFLARVYPRPPGDPAIEGAVSSEAEALDARSDERLVAAALHRTLALWHDAHLMTGIPARLATAELSLTPVLPVRVGPRVLVDASQPPLPPGTELLELEGRTLPILLDDLARYAPVDAAAREVRLAVAERDFARLLYLELGMRDTYSMVVRRPGEAPEPWRARGLDRADIGALQRARRSAARLGAQRAGEPAWPFLVDLGAGTRLLRLASFALEDVEGYRRRVDDIFETLQGNERLVLDVRGNAGGIRHHGVAVLRHLLERDFAQWARVQTRVLAIPGPFRSRVTFPVGSEESLRSLPWEKRGSTWVFEGDPLVNLMKPAGAVHRGELVVFVDDATNSAAVEMVVALLAQRPETVVVGAETRGGCARHTGELPVVFTTPRSGIPVVVSLFEVELVASPRCAFDRGVVPQVAVDYEEAAFAGGLDPYLEALEGLTAPDDRR